MKSMLRNLGMGLVLFLVLMLTTMIKHVPLNNLLTFSSFLAMVGCIVAMGLSVGFENVLLAFLGRCSEAAEGLIRAIFLVSSFSAVVSMTVVFANLTSNPDLVGPGMQSALTSFLYGLLLAGYLMIANRTVKVSNHFIYYACASVFAGLSMTTAVLFVVAS